MPYPGFVCASAVRLRLKVLTKLNSANLHSILLKYDVITILGRHQTQTQSKDVATKTLKNSKRRLSKILHRQGIYQVMRNLVLMMKDARVESLKEERSKLNQKSKVL